ncbi:YafY family protein [Prevotella sp. 10(H)]|uniref:helix-turn-helix transcriptional regulator n=1 Tax=Prevotella sp. 10(H) TaxID=1158294 RepID=UPI0004A6F069|nr:YafY family protein [Prevotella sp. 10(H)]
MNRLERISAILVRLQSRSVVTARQIADQFGISLRTVYRDIKVLEESGIPITGEAGIGYSLVEGFKLPPLMFSVEEAIAFLMAEKLISRQTDGDTHRLYRSGMDKIRAVLKNTERNILEDFDEYIHVLEDHTLPHSEASNILQPLLNCIIEKRCSKIEYFANYNREITSRDIEPLGIYYMVNNWYVFAWCRLRKDYRTFNLSLIRKITPSENKFTKEHPDVQTLLETIYAREETFNVKVRVNKSALRSMGRTKYIFGLLNEEDDGTDYVIQHYITYSLDQFARWYITFADQASIIEPLEFKDSVRKILENIKL